MLNQDTPDLVKAATILGGSLLGSTLLAGVFFSPFQPVRDIIGVLILVALAILVLKKIVLGNKS